MKIYVAGPYSGDSLSEIAQHVQDAIDVGLKIWEKGHFPYIPHLTHWSDIRAQESRFNIEWSDYARWHGVWLDQCDALFLLGESKGALMEYTHAKETGLKIFHSLDEIPQLERSLTWVDSVLDL